MKKLLVEYFNMIGYALCGIIFGLTFFLIFINFYHYNDISSTYLKQESDFKANKELKDKLQKINDNVASFDINNYSGTENIYALASIKTRLETCSSKINNEDLTKILDKKEVTIKDVYEMQQFYQINISNECLVKQLYELVTPTDNPNLQISKLNELSPFLKNNIEDLMKSTDYLQKVIKNNSSYSFSSNSSKIDLYEQTKDSYYALLNNYRSAIDFIYDISVWYKEVLG